MRAVDRDAPIDATRANRRANADARGLGLGYYRDVCPLKCRQNRFAGESREYIIIYNNNNIVAPVYGYNILHAQKDECDIPLQSRSRL